MLSHLVSPRSSFPYRTPYTHPHQTLFSVSRYLALFHVMSHLNVNKKKLESWKILFFRLYTKFFFLCNEEKTDLTFLFHYALSLAAEIWHGNFPINFTTFHAAILSQLFFTTKSSPDSRKAFEWRCLDDCRRRSFKIECFIKLFA